MAQPPSGDENEKEKPPPPRTPKAEPARRASPRAVTAEPVKLSDIDLKDTSLQFRVFSPSKELLPDLEREGQREPIELFGVEPPYRIVDGFRRVAAAHELGWDSVKAFVHRGIDEKEAMRIAFTKRLSGENLSVPEKAHAIALTRSQGLGWAEISELFGLSERQVHRYMKYLRLPES